MQDDLFKKFCDDINKRKNVIESNNIELEKLRENPDVKRYIDLLNEQIKLTHGTMSLNLDMIIDDVYDSKIKNLVTDTNEIWYLFGFYNYDYDKEIYYKTFLEELKEHLFIYINLENFDIIKISIKEKDNFEKENQIIEATHFRNWEQFTKVRNVFLKLCLEEGQEQAKRKILKINSGVNKNE